MEVIKKLKKKLKNNFGHVLCLLKGEHKPGRWRKCDSDKEDELTPYDRKKCKTCGKTISIRHKGWYYHPR